MMAFCKKSVHSFLSLSNPLLHIDTNHYTTNTHHTNDYDFISHHEKPPPAPPGGLGLITGDAQKVPNVLESAAVKKEKENYPLPPATSSPASSLLSLLSPPSSLMSSLSPHSPGKKDPGGVGFIDDIGGGVDGLMSCTESLGFESCDERQADDEMLELSSSDHTVTRSMSKVIKWRKVGERREVKKFPPPLSSLNPNGQPCFFLRPVRRDGRLELTEVRIDRPEILRASREGGRLRLLLVRDEGEDQEEEEEEEEEEIEGEEELLLDNDNNNNYNHHNDNIREEGISLELHGQEENKNMEEGFDQVKLVENEKLSEEDRRVSSATNTVTNNNNGDQSTLRRCHEGAAVGHVHHHRRRGNHHNDNLHVWSQQCVTTCR